MGILAIIVYGLMALIKNENLKLTYNVIIS